MLKSQRELILDTLDVLDEDILFLRNMRANLLKALRREEEPVKLSGPKILEVMYVKVNG